MYVYCTYYAPICHANGMEKASFARIVGAERRAAHYIQKAVWKKWAISLDLKERSDLADLTSWGSLLIPNRLGRAGEGVHYFYTADYIRSA